MASKFVAMDKAWQHKMYHLCWTYTFIRDSARRPQVIPRFPLLWIGLCGKIYFLSFFFPRLREHQPNFLILFSFNATRNRLLACFARWAANPTGHFAISETQNSSIFVFELHKMYQSRHSKSSKVWKQFGWKRPSRFPQSNLTYGKLFFLKTQHTSSSCGISERKLQKIPTYIMVHC